MANIVTKEQVITSAEIYAAQHMRAVKVYEVVLPEWAHSLYLANPGDEPKFASLVEDTLDAQLPKVMELLPHGTTLREIFRATPPQWN